MSLSCYLKHTSLMFGVGRKHTYRKAVLAVYRKVWCPMTFSFHSNVGSFNLFIILSINSSFY